SRRRASASAALMQTFLVKRVPATSTLWQTTLFGSVFLVAAAGAEAAAGAAGASVAEGAPSANSTIAAINSIIRLSVLAGPAHAGHTSSLLQIYIEKARSARACRNFLLKPRPGAEFWRRNLLRRHIRVCPAPAPVFATPRRPARA